MHSTHTGDVDMFDMKGVNRLLNNLGTRDVVCSFICITLTLLSTLNHL